MVARKRMFSIQIVDSDAFLDMPLSTYYNIACPYAYGDKRAFCYKKDVTSREICFKCKEKWLDSEIDM